jgi:hypothetical protein
MHVAIWLIFLLSGNLLLVAGIGLTRYSWRSDIEPFGRGSPTLQIMLHPERFLATKQRLGAIRLLNWLGILCLGVSVAVLIYDIALIK